MLVWGLVIVLVDFRVNGKPDIIADPLGWLLCLLALAGVLSRTRSGWFALAVAGTVLGGIASLEEYVSPPNGWVVVSLTTVATTAVVWGTCSGIITSHPDDGRRATANLIRWSDLSLTIMMLALVTTAQGDTFGIGAPELLLLIVPAFAVFIWFIVFVNRIQPEDLVPAAGAVA